MATVDKVFRALGDPVRIRIVEMLSANGEMCVCQIMEELGMTQSAVSHHLATMKNAELIHPRRQEQWIHYSLCPEAITEIGLAFLNETVAKLSSATDGKPCDCE